MAGKGGYQAPSNPAPVSGPGSLSRRTDGGPGSKQAQRYVAGMPNYGDGQDMMQIQGGAPMAATPSPTPVSAAQMAQNAQQQQAQGQPQTPVTPLTAPTARPNEPVSAGANAGPGPGMAALGITPGQMNNAGQSTKQIVQALASHPDASPELQKLAQSLGQ